MATVKTIKDVDEDSWSEFKELASKNNMNMGKFFVEVVNSYKKNENTWKELLNGPKLLSDKEADEMMEIVANMRKEHGFRKIKWD